jgi:hypothetical protein
LNVAGGQPSLLVNGLTHAALRDAFLIAGFR